MISALFGIAQGAAHRQTAMLQLRNGALELPGRIIRLHTLVDYGVPIGLWVSIERLGFAARS
jgi:hypothetical protein